MAKRSMFDELKQGLHEMKDERHKSKAKKVKAAPKFKSEQEEREFWETKDSSDYVDWSGAEPVYLPNLKP